MNWTEKALKNQAVIAVAVAIIVLFGGYSLMKLPVQLFPDIERPRINIQTTWRAASPQEIESEIVEPQEDVLQGLSGLVDLEAYANRGISYVNLTFSLETDMQKSLIEVISRLNRIPPLPDDADSPIIRLGDGDGSSPALTYFFVQLLPETPGKIYDYHQRVEDLIKPRLESIPGVSGIDIRGGTPEEVQIKFDPYLAAQLGIPITNVANLVGRDKDVSGGFVDVGRRQYTMRFIGNYEPEDLSELVLDWRNGRPIRLGDVAEITKDRGKRVSFSVQNGNPALSLRVERENGANVLKTLNLVKAEVAKLQANELKAMGLDIAQSFDASVFIYRAIGLVTNNLFAGILLAIGVLWLFLRERRSTLIIAMAIPICLLTTFIVLNVTGRSLNVISLAGLAFAVGMVMDAAIVVLENIVRLKEKGNESFKACLTGTRQVWGALLASTATTIAIFFPIIFLKDVEGQLFADLAFTIAVSVLASLFVAITVLPVAASKWIKPNRLKDNYKNIWDGITKFVMWLTDKAYRRVAVIGILMSSAAFLTISLLPNMDYLPPVKRDAVDAFFSMPPGANIDAIDEELVQVMVDRLDPYMKGEKEPALKNYYFLVFPNFMTLGIRALDQSKVGILEKLVNEEITKDLPDTRVFATQGNLFGRFGGNRSIDMRVQSADMDALAATSKRGMELIREALPGSQVRPQPEVDMAQPELRIIPNDRRVAESGWNRSDLSTIVRSLGDGLYVGEYFDGEQRMNIILKGEGWDTPESLANLPIATPAGSVVPLGELIDVVRTVGPGQLSRIDGKRTITLSVNPPNHMSLEEALTTIEEKVEPELLSMLPTDASIQYGGSADSMKQAVATMGENFVIAMIILFLIMSALFRSMKDSLLVVLTLPLATVGGVFALRLLNLVTFQPLDLLTMIGFIIMLGLVVNNAILLVHQSRALQQEGIDRKNAVQQALRARLRPIFMSTLTSIFGMLPLLLIPGEGSVIYRGLAAVIVGGMSVSTIFTLILLPSLLRMEFNPIRLTKNISKHTPIKSNIEVTPS